jgi:hypothetical protein
LPVHTTTHKLTEDRRILVDVESYPIIYEERKYVTISIPTKPAAESLSARQAARRGG